MLASESIKNFPSNFTLTYLTLQFFSVSEMTIFTRHCNVCKVLFNIEDGILIKDYIRIIERIAAHDLE